MDALVHSLLSIFHSASIPANVVLTTPKTDLFLLINLLWKPPYTFAQRLDSCVTPDVVLTILTIERNFWGWAFSFQPK